MNWNRTVGVLALALLVVVAGCTGGGGSTGEATTTPPDVAQSENDDGTAPDTATTAPSTTAGTTGDQDGATTSGGPGDAGDPEVRRFVEAGTSVLLDSDGPVVEVESTSKRGGRTATTNGTIRWEAANGELFAVVRTDGRTSLTVEQYQPPDSETVYQCVFRNGSCQVRQEQSAAAVGVDPTTLLGGVLDDDRFGQFEERGTVSTELGRLERYVLDGVDELPPSLQGRQGNVTTYRVELFFDPETGALRKAHAETAIETEAGTDSSELTVTYTEVGGVTVEPPEWYEE